MAATKLRHLPRRHQPAGCRHHLLQECPLTVADWAEVMNAWLAFKYQCGLISERAHARETPDSPLSETFKEKR